MKPEHYSRYNTSSTQGPPHGREDTLVTVHLIKAKEEPDCLTKYTVQSCLGTGHKLLETGISRVKSASCILLFELQMGGGDILFPRTSLSLSDIYFIT